MKHVVVIGGGVIGVSTAWALLEAGFKVSLVERAAQLASATSHANGGQLSYRYVAPFADAGVPLKAMGWMLDSDGPVRFRLEANPHQWAWIAAFLRRCNAVTHARVTKRLLALGAYSQTAFAQFVSAAQLKDIALRTPGKLVVYRQSDEFVRVCAKTRALADATQRVLGRQACIDLEPALADARNSFVGGIFTEGEAVADCRLLTLQLGERLQVHPNFQGVVHANATGFHQVAGRLTALKTTVGDLAGDAFVLAAGLQSRQIAQWLGISLPLYPLKGYSLTAPIGQGHRPPEVSVTDAERKIVYARIGTDLRVAAMADIVGEDERIDPQRIGALMRCVKATFPNAANFEAPVAWMGLRPATPSGAPILGSSPIPGLWLNVGHGALGLTLAFASANILAALVSGQPSPVPLDGLRFSR